MTFSLWFSANISLFHYMHSIAYIYLVVNLPNGLSLPWWNTNDIIKVLENNRDEMIHQEMPSLIG